MLEAGGPVLRSKFANPTYNAKLPKGIARKVIAMRLSPSISSAMEDDDDTKKDLADLISQEDQEFVNSPFPMLYPLPRAECETDKTYGDLNQKLAFCEAPKCPRLSFMWQSHLTYGTSAPYCFQYSRVLLQCCVFRVALKNHRRK